MTALQGVPAFLSTLSLRRATRIERTRQNDPCYFYPRSPCGERLQIADAAFRVIAISIHALLAESDLNHFCRALCKRKFLSTLSLRRATLDRTDLPRVIIISIHALLAESDAPWRRNRPPHCYFYPRSPCGERPRFYYCHLYSSWISIHALLAESDGSGTQHLRRNIYFYPRSPCGERPPIMYKKCRAERFLSTLSLRRATRTCASSVENRAISIHALLAESDP